MKLIHTLSAFDVFGPEKTVLNECAELTRAGWETEIVNFWHVDDTPIRAKAMARGIGYSCIVSGGRFDPGAVYALVRRLRSQGRPLVHSHGYKADLYSLLAARIAGAPAVTTVHGWTSENFKVRMYERLQANLWRFFDRVYCVSENYCGVARTAGAAHRKVILVPNGIPMSYHIERTAEARGVARQRIGIADNQVAVAIIGRLGIEKGHDFFLRCAADVVKTRPNAMFIVVGEGVERGNIEALVERLGLQPFVKMLGHRDDMPEVYPAIDILSITSLREGLPNVLLEAMLHGIPAVATPVGGIPDVIRHGEDGFLAGSQEPGRYCEALDSLIGDPALRVAMGERARERILKNYLFEQRVRNVESGAIWCSR